MNKILILLVFIGLSTFAFAQNTCATAIVINQAALPFNSGSQTTCGTGNDYGVGTGACNSTYGGGEDYVYQLNVTSAPVNINFNLGGTGTWKIMQVYAACPSPVGSPANCLYNITTGGGSTATGNFNFTTNGTYFIVIDTWPSPACGNFQLQLSVIVPPTCPGGLGTGVVNVASLPFSQTGQTTCGQINNLTAANIPVICGSSSYYGGEDVVYTFTPTSSGLTNINVTSSGSWVGIMLYSGCPFNTGACVANAQGSAGNQSICATVSAGQTYYLIIDSWPAPTCNPFNISISAPSACSGSIPSTTAAASPTSACGTLITNLSLSPAVGLCGVSFQWQSAPALAGPYTNILGATNASQSATTTVSVFYRCVLTCGASTLASAPVQTSVSPNPTVSCSLSTYTAAPITYSFEAFTGTALPTTDDILFNSITMFGFPICYGGSQYWGGYVASNSSFVFAGVPCFPNIGFGTMAAPGIGTGWSITNPAPVINTSIPRNAILGPWQDIDPSIGGTMRYYTAGVAPNRRFVVSYENIPMFSCGTSSPAIYFTGQIKIYETTNIIEIHIGNKGVCSGWNNGQAVMGLHSYDGTIYIPPVNMTAHNATAGPPYNQWSMTNTAYRFNSPCASSGGPCAVLPIGFISFTGENQENKNHLNWKVEGNANFSRFVIERSLDGINFSEIATVSTSSKLEYNYDDDSFKPFVINYYRISGIGKNNEMSKTAIVPVGSKSDDFEIGNLFPNPTEKGFAVQINSKLVQPMQMTICNALGVEVHKEMITSQLGYSTHQFKTNNLPAGLYIVKFHNKENQKLNEQKLVIGKGQ